MWAPGKEKEKATEKSPDGQPSASRTLVSAVPADKKSLSTPSNLNYVSCPAQVVSTPYKYFFVQQDL